MLFVKSKNNRKCCCFCRFRFRLLNFQFIRFGFGFGFLKSEKWVSVNRNIPSTLHNIKHVIL